MTGGGLAVLGQRWVWGGGKFRGGLLRKWIDTKDSGSLVREAGGNRIIWGG